ncbi:Leucine Rich Repeat family protein [Trichomonas vaginalis G3]|uniref:Leucine Rich Repeat family protein n=1 Tax=Trichomonas vaginalis (strain ATCC PRA-98 / G3) TaxID=412133 RepID=A2DZ64_TRIV3|nr:uncharacterized protein TVAGG3_0505110 [Trichomonas vaginalis G3]EAY14340.1 Leucine Rich Repeat family protein [Trichomonas vaginalis G3]KAI5517365.1 axoneme assembly [Trichomonas vaginalis G3]|eukprot:XP_001326563.1 hypothetical protein [Trichomonas vaginalis G3]
MLERAILEFPGDRTRYEVDNIANYEGPNELGMLEALEAKVDTRELTLTFLGEMFPNLQKLRLNNSIIPSVRDIGCELVNLRFLSLASCNLTSLDGISTLSHNLEELYVAFNQITDFCDLLGMERLRIVDFEDNLIENLEDIEILTTSPQLQALTLAGNPAAKVPDYREKVAKLLPKLVYLDEKRLKPRKPKTPRIQKQPSTVKFEEGSENNVPRSIEKMVKEPPSPPPQPVEEPHPPASPEPADKITIAPLDFSHIDDDEILMTEQIRDKIDDRPPSSYGSFESKGFPGFFKNAPTKTSSKSILTPGKPRIFRPVSAKGRPSH